MYGPEHVLPVRNEKQDLHAAMQNRSFDFDQAD